MNSPRFHNTSPNNRLLYRSLLGVPVEYKEGLLLLFGDGELFFFSIALNARSQSTDIGGSSKDMACIVCFCYIRDGFNASLPSLSRAYSWPTLAGKSPFTGIKRRVDTNTTLYKKERVWLVAEPLKKRANKGIARSLGWRSYCVYQPLKTYCQHINNNIRCFWESLLHHILNSLYHQPAAGTTNNQSDPWPQTPK